MKTNPGFMPYTGPRRLTAEEMLVNSNTFLRLMRQRRTVREFSSEPIDMQVIETAIETAGTAPSGANQQPWHFAVITSPEIKSKIRQAAELEEAEFYAGRAGDVWLDTLAPLGTDAHKPFLEEAPVLIAIFEQKFQGTEKGDRIKHYYAKESTGIATGILITALHRLGLATLTHTPSPMNFLSEILNRPAGERPFLLLVVGYPKADTQVPVLEKKSLRDICSRH